MKKFFERFDKKRFMLVTKIVFIIVSVAIIMHIFGNTYTRYESTVDLNANANVAFFVIDQGTYENSISLSGLEPRQEPFYYTFYVANYNTDNLRTKVDLDYKVTFETTTKLPLEYEIIRNQSFNGTYTNIIDDHFMRQDSDGVFYEVYADNDQYRFTHNSNQVDQYSLKVVFPEKYKDYPDLYQGVIELFSIIVDASQVA